MIPFFKQWTTKNIVTFVIMVILLMLTVIASTFIADYENAKNEAIVDTEQLITDTQLSINKAENDAQAQLDEQLLQSSDDNALKADAIFRRDYTALYDNLNNIFLGTSEDNNDLLPDEQRQALPNGFVTLMYVNDTDLTSGYVYVVGPETAVYTFEAADNAITALNYKTTVDMGNVQIVQE